MWKIYDNYHERILDSEYETEQLAENRIDELIAEHKAKNESYDYDTVEEITKEQAKEEYIKGTNVYVTTDKRTMWKMPASYQYASHAPASELFYRSLPKYEGTVRFFVK